jgi:hypothetical protein
MGVSGGGIKGAEGGSGRWELSRTEAEMRKM